MKIKTVKKMRLDELIKHVWENEVFPSVWRSNESPSDKWTIQFFEDGMFRSYNGFHYYDTFAVTVEEELTKDTVFDELVFVYKDHSNRTITGSMVHKCIRDIMRYKAPIYKIYALTDKSLELIWTFENQIPESGVLEVSE